MNCTGSIREAIAPLQWDETFSGPPQFCSLGTPGLDGALLRHWIGTAPQMPQPALDHHYIILHLGGPKRVTRRCGTRCEVVDAGEGSVSVVPAGESFDWSTEGPIEFAHLYVHPALLDRIVRETFDRDPAGVELIDGIAQRSDLIASLIGAIAKEVRSPGDSARLLIDSLLHSLAISLLAKGSTLPSVKPARHCISPSRLRRVTDFIDAHYGDDISLDDLATLAGSSRFHFSRGFKAATGLPPYHYLIRHRLGVGKTLLDLRRQSISQIAAQCGYGSTRQFSAMFVRIFGITPRRYRQEH